MESNHENLVALENVRDECFLLGAYGLALRAAVVEIVHADDGSDASRSAQQSIERALACMRAPATESELVDRLGKIPTDEFTDPVPSFEAEEDNSRCDSNSFSGVREQLELLVSRFAAVTPFRLSVLLLKDWGDVDYKRLARMIDRGSGGLVSARSRANSTLRGAVQDEPVSSERLRKFTGEILQARLLRYDTPYPTVALATLRVVAHVLGRSADGRDEHGKAPVLPERLRAVANELVEREDLDGGARRVCLALVCDGAKACHNSMSISLETSLDQLAKDHGASADFVEHTVIPIQETMRGMLESVAECFELALGAGLDGSAAALVRNWHARTLEEIAHAHSCPKKRHERLARACAAYHEAGDTAHAFDAMAASLPAGIGWDDSCLELRESFDTKKTSFRLPLRNAVRLARAGRLAEADERLKIAEGRILSDDEGADEQSVLRRRKWWRGELACRLLRREIELQLTRE